MGFVIYRLILTEFQHFSVYFMSKGERIPLIERLY